MPQADQYDYIVVGGGSSGCVAANRLVTDHGARVLLLEAGPENKDLRMRWPALAFTIIYGKTAFIKRYKSVPQPHLGGKSIEVAQASVLGGGSSVNIMAYLRGSKADYARWTEAAGGVAWGWNEMVRIFRRQEGNSRFDNENHGGDGPFKVSDARSIPKSTGIFMKTMQRLGLPYRDDFGGGDLNGVGMLQSTIYEGRRCSAADAFIAPIRKDPRLTVLTSAKATKLRFEGDRAVGVEFLRRGKPGYAAAAKEIILTAGPLATPKLLMLSGVGPRDQLDRHGIACIADRPGVGENLHDHPIISVTVATKGAFGVYGADKGLTAAVNALRYLSFADGPISAGGSDAIAFTNISGTSGEPDIQVYCIPLMLPGYTGGRENHGLTLCANFVQPRARGRVWLQSADPTEDLAVDYNWLGDPEDSALMLRGMKYLRKIAATEPLASIVQEERVPGAHVQSDEDLLAEIRQNVRTYYHPVGTCKMGTDDDPMAVLTPDLRVRGVTGVRVFDVSMIPNITSSATNATAMAIAERGVELMMQRAAT